MQKVGLSWTAPTDDGNSQITDYIIQYRTGSDSWNTFTDAVSDLTRTNVTGLSNGNTYEFRVAAKNINGTGSYTVAVSATPRTTPGMPAGLAAEAGNAQVSLSWTVPPDDGGSKIIDYVIQYRQGAGNAGWSVFPDAVSPSTAAAVTGLVNDHTYEFRVFAVNVAGAGLVPSATDEATPRIPVLPDTRAPAISIVPVGPVEATDSSTTVVLISLPTVTDLYDEPDQIKIHTNITGAWQLASAPIEIPLALGTHTIHWSATDTSGNSDNATQSITVQDTAPPEIILTGPSAMSITFGQTYTEQGAMCRDTVDGSTAAVISGDMVNNTLIGTYTITYDCTDMQNNTAEPISRTVMVVAIPAPPAGLTALAGDSQVVLSWSSPSGDAQVTDYVIRYSTNNTNWVVFDDGVSANTNATVTGLANGIAYTFEVLAVNLNVTGVSHASVSSTPFSSAPPSSAAFSAFALQPASETFTASSSHDENWTAPKRCR